MAQMIRPRDMLEGEYSLGEQKVLEQIKKLRGGEKKPTSPKPLFSSGFSDQASLFKSKASKDEIVRVDSLVESAFNSEENAKWENYRFSIKDPAVSERSEENHLIHSAGRS
jgi:hypothetical protein